MKLLCVMKISVIWFTVCKHNSCFNSSMVRYAKRLGPLVFCVANITIYLVWANCLTYHTIIFVSNIHVYCHGISACALHVSQLVPWSQLSLSLHGIKIPLGFFSSIDAVIKFSYIFPVLIWNGQQHNRYILGQRINVLWFKVETHINNICMVVS